MITLPNGVEVLHLRQQKLNPRKQHNPPCEVPFAIVHVKAACSLCVTIATVIMYCLQQQFRFHLSHCVMHCRSLQSTLPVHAVLTPDLSSFGIQSINTLTITGTQQGIRGHTDNGSVKQQSTCLLRVTAKVAVPLVLKAMTKKMHGHLPHACQIMTA